MDKDIMKKIKEFERSSQKIIEKKEDKLDFDEWWAMRHNKFTINPYLKDVLKADAKGRGLKNKHSIQEWDSAARMYGLIF